LWIAEATKPEHQYDHGAMVALLHSLNLVLRTRVLLVTDLAMTCTPLEMLLTTAAAVTGLRALDTAGVSIRSA
jgi:hypothetical protein